MLRALIPLALAPALLLAGCTPQSVEPVETPTASPSPTATDAAVGPGPDPAAACLDPASVTSAVGADVTAGAVGVPPAGPVDAALGGVPRELCTYDLADGTRLGYSPLVITADSIAMEAALAPVVEHDDCGLLSGYLTTGYDTYYLWTGGSFAAAYILAGDPTDPEVLLAKLMDDAADLCGTGDTGPDA